MCICTYNLPTIYIHVSLYLCCMSFTEITWYWFQHSSVTLGTCNQQTSSFQGFAIRKSRVPSLGAGCLKNLLGLPSWCPIEVWTFKWHFVILCPYRSTQILLHGHSVSLKFFVFPFGVPLREKIPAIRSQFSISWSVSQAGHSLTWAAPYKIVKTNGLQSTAKMTRHQYLHQTLHKMLFYVVFPNHTRSKSSKIQGQRACREAAAADSPGVPRRAVMRDDVLNQWDSCG